MKAVMFYGKEDVRLEEVPAPELRPGTVRVRPAWTGICGSDLHLYFDGPFPPAPGVDTPHPGSGETLPVVFGHEFSGTVLELGEGVEGLAVGDAVVIEPYITCGECHACAAGRYNLCDTMGFIGISGHGGGLSEEIVVERRWVHPVGDLPLDQAALIEPLSVAVHGVRTSGARAGQVAVVGGAGPIGLLTGAVLKAMDVTVVMTEVSAARKAKALETGVADHVVDPTSEDVVALVRELTDGRGADVAYECAGVQVVTELLMDTLTVGGVLQILAIYSAPIPVDMVTIVLKELQVRGSIGYANAHPFAIELARSGKVDLSRFITDRIAAEDIEEAGYRALATSKDDHVKILVHM